MPDSRDWTVTVTHSPNADQGPMESVVATAVPARDPPEAVRRAVDTVTELGDRYGGSWEVRAGLAEDALDPDADKAAQRKFKAYPLDDAEPVRRNEIQATDDN
jgi:hypothetical protein